MNIANINLIVYIYITNALPFNIVSIVFYSLDQED